MKVQQRGGIIKNKLKKLKNVKFVKRISEGDRKDTVRFAGYVAGTALIFTNAVHPSVEFMGILDEFI